MSGHAVPGSLNAQLLREASGTDAPLTKLRERLLTRTGRATDAKEADRAASRLLKRGLLTRPTRGRYALTVAGERELDRLHKLEQE